MNESRYPVSYPVKYMISGMTCDRCADAVTRELTPLAGVRRVEVDLAAGRVEVTSDGPLAVAEVRAVVTEAGFELVA